MTGLMLRDITNVITLLSILINKYRRVSKGYINRFDFIPRIMLRSLISI